MFLSPKTLKQYRKYDGVISLGGDTFSDKPNIAYSLLHCINLLPAILFHKPYAICSQSIGPFGITKKMAKFVLNRASSITVRDSVSKDYLTKNLNVQCKLHRDIVYCLNGNDTRRTEGVIGIIPSSIAHKYMKISQGEYMKFMKELIEKLDKVVLIPFTSEDSKLVREYLGSEHLRSPDDIKRCRLIIGFRMHACVSAIKLEIPTVVLSYSWKYSGVPKLPWVKVIDLRNISSSELETSILTTIPQLLKSKPREEDIQVLKESALGHIEAINHVCQSNMKPLLGEYIKCYQSYAADGEIRRLAASGGTVTSLLNHALESRSVICLNGSTPTKYSSQEDVLHCVGSNYPSPDDNLTSMMKLCSNEELVVVGLPCQVRVLKHLFPKNTYVGLFCSHKIEQRGIHFFSEHYHLNSNPLKYKAKVNGKVGLLVGETFFPSKQYWSHFFNFAFIPKKCLRCRDQTNEYADISVGDAWPNIDKNVVITRTPKGEELLRKSALVLKEISPGDILKTQKGYVQLKKGMMSNRLRVYKALRNVGNTMSDRPKMYWLLHLWLNVAVNRRSTR